MTSRTIDALVVLIAVVALPSLAASSQIIADRVPAWDPQCYDANVCGFKVRGADHRPVTIYVTIPGMEQYMNDCPAAHRPDHSPQLMSQNTANRVLWVAERITLIGLKPGAGPATRTVGHPDLRFTVTNVIVDFEYYDPTTYQDIILRNFSLKQAMLKNSCVDPTPPDRSDRDDLDAFDFDAIE